jgi:hypothetical protein
LAGRKGTAILLMVVSAGLLFASVPQVVGEASALVGMLRPAELRSAAIAERDLLPAGSIVSKDEYFRSCLDIPASLTGLLRPPAERARLIDACRDMARATQLEMPTYALPFLVDADASAMLGEPFVAALEQARRLAPHVHWQTDRRVVLARAQTDKLDGAGRAGFDRDLVELFGSAEGRRALAMHFLRWPDLRDRLTSMAETMPAEIQRDFLAKVTQQAGGAS